MIKLNEDQVNACIGYFSSERNQILKNGDKGYFIEGDQITVITCCDNCGDYSRICLSKIDAKEMLTFLLCKN